jgi:hypothetical protein
MSRFALTGLHNLVACSKCHVTVAFKDAKSDCWSCHDKQDVHMRRLGTDCETCHNTRDWRDWDFDHDKTRFKLLNGHATPQCVDCHVAPVAKKIGKIDGCSGCHGKDDTHDGAFGENCDRCHTDLAWRNIKIGSIEFINQNSNQGQPGKAVSTTKKPNNKKLSKKKTKAQR